MLGKDKDETDDKRQEYNYEAGEGARMSDADGPRDGHYGLDLQHLVSADSSDISTQGAETADSELRAPEKKGPVVSLTVSLDHEDLKRLIQKAVDKHAAEVTRLRQGIIKLHTRANEISTVAIEPLAREGLAEMIQICNELLKGD